MERLPKEYLSRLIRCIVEFDLIQEKDRILIGLSGGKDSLFMTYALSEMKKQLNYDFSLACITVNPLFEKDFDKNPLHEFCDKLEIPLFVQDIDIADIVHAQDDKNPCYTCAFFRRGAINGFAKEHNYNKIAYAHNHDDAVHTFIMNMFFSGQIKTFMPKTYLSKTDLHVIRPILYFREKEMVSAIKYHKQKPIAPPCPFNGHTKREMAKNLIDNLSKENPLIYDHISNCIRENHSYELWPKKLNRKEIKDKYNDFFKSLR